MNLRNLLIIVVIFTTLVFYNQFVAKEAVVNTKESPLVVSLISYPETTKVGNRNTFIWQVNATNDLSTDFSTLYWSANSSPSALTKLDSPSAVGYERFVPDFTSGTFFLPYTFESTIVFDQPQTVYFRAYAKVRDNHLWSEEKKITIQP